LAEAMLYTAKATDRLGRVADGTTVLDFDAEEKRRKTSVSTAVAAIEWNGAKINIIDTPGLFDFAGGVSEGVRAADSVLIVTAAGSGFDVGAEKALKAANARGISRMFAVTRCDAENTNFYKTFAAIKEAVGGAICPVIVPYMEGDKVKAYVNLASRKAFDYSSGAKKEVDMPSDPQLDEMLDILTEAVASSDDELMEKFFEGESFTREEIIKALNSGVSDGSVIPVYACAGYTCDAVDMLLDEIVYSAPSAAEKAGEGDIPCDENGPLAAICFKTVADPFVGKMSFFKVVSGKITPDTPAYNSRTEESERMGKIVTVKGAKQEDAACIPAGDIGVVTKLSGVKTGDTICSQKNPVTLEGVTFPAPCLSMAVKVRKKGDEEKVAAGLARLVEEDPTISFVINKETREQILSGLGEQHLDVVVSKLKTKFGVEVDISVPIVA
ncbi:MAG: elongation factor G, partial [Oscillospiraceae bacterium]|nr:elongation factor G [Oscillospiraceae bacterium]